ncbi:restriction endonuclease subunit S [Oceanicella sp. SM1341]|uniref:restriction endonuclease subunit S n=1 Tax=Oceanicella sp. SM1341 TaxID=1548889 RepID=UPI000E49C136|nr:restriction endonuclease subunit S [Oceanicella sp. SM1341]
MTDTKLPEGWIELPIEKLARITTGSCDTKDREANGEYPFFVRSQTIERINSIGFDGEGVLTAGDGVGTGKIFHYINGKCDFHQRVYLMHAFSPEITGRYFYYYFSSFFYDRIMSMTAKSSVDSVRREMIADMMVRLPMDPKEQDRIVEALSDADALIEGLERLIAKKRLIKQGAMQDLLTAKRRLPGFSGEWVARTLPELAEIRSGGTPSTSAPEMWDGDIAWCTPTDITSLKGTRFLSQTSRYITDLGLRKSAAELLPEGTIVMTSRATIGECAIATVPISTNQGFKNFIARPDTDRDFLFYLLSFQKAGFIELCSGSTFLEIGMGQLRKYQVMTPEGPSEQKAIAQVLNDMDAEIHALDTRLAKARQVKEGMMQNLLTGRIRLV